jgi:lysophospholipase L1-like esterase
MKFKMLAVAMAFCSCTGVMADVAARAADAPHKIKIVLVGDSTMNDQGGWGYGFKQFLTNAECINTAMNGRSSMSFMREGRWTNALALHADYYFIQFGHNNQPGHSGRETDMPTFVGDMKKYVDDAKAIGAKPILVTPLCRRQWDKENPGKIKSTLEEHAAEVRKIASEKNVPLIDLHERSKEYYEKAGKEACEKFSPVKTVDGTNSYDGTHLKGEGRVLMARLVVDEVRKNVPELAPYLLAEPNPALVASENAETKKGQAKATEEKP